jgi:hypothetical protein
VEGTWLLPASSARCRALQSKRASELLSVGSAAHVFDAPPARPKANDLQNEFVRINLFAKSDRS